MIPGEIITVSGDIELNKGLPTVTFKVANSGDRPIQVGSHYHFFETNEGLKFDRERARGMRLDIAAGTAMRFEPGILASVVALGLLVALAVDLPVSAGVAIIGLFALFHGHAHGTEVPENAGGLEYMAGFATATLLLHATGIATGLGLGIRFRGLARAAGAACAAIGIGLAFGIV